MLNHEKINNVEDAIHLIINRGANINGNKEINKYLYDKLLEEDKTKFVTFIDDAKKKLNISLKKNIREEIVKMLDENTKAGLIKKSIKNAAIEYLKSMGCKIKSK
jgi:uncharacterized FlaG/YvyC family protein